MITQYVFKVCYMQTVSSCVVDTLSGNMPDYLHGRPHWFVQHCVSQLRNAAKMDLEALWTL